MGEDVPPVDIATEGRLGASREFHVQVGHILHLSFVARMNMPAAPERSLLVSGSATRSANAGLGRRPITRKGDSP